MKYLVLGGYGAMGSITVKDLVMTTKYDEIIIAGRNLKKAQLAAKSYKSSRVRAMQVDIFNQKALVKTLQGIDVVINAVQYEYNIQIMKACLVSRCHYVDLGGLFHITRKQLKLHQQFKKKKLVAVLGMGAAPGITNMLAAYGAEKLDKIESIHIKLGAYDNTKVLRSHPLPSSYSLQTILEEFSYQPAVFTKGKFTFVESMSGMEEYTFPKPVGKVKPMYTIHSEIATLPITYKHKGVKEVSFKIAFDDDFVDKVRFLRDIGMASEEPVEIKRTKVKPRDVLIAALKKLPPPLYGKVDEYEIIRVIVSGKKSNKKKTYTIDCHTKGMPAWNLGLDIDTGSPPSIVAQMITQNQIKGKGVLPPEQAVQPSLFFKALKKRKMKVSINGTWL